MAPRHKRTWSPPPIPPDVQLLIEEAACFGDVAVSFDPPLILQEITISFRRSSGSRVHAVGKSTDIKEAYKIAIAEAAYLRVELGDKP